MKKNYFIISYLILIMKHLKIINADKRLYDSITIAIKWWSSRDALSYIQFLPIICVKEVFYFLINCK